MNTQRGGTRNGNLRARSMTRRRLEQELASLRERLAEAEETLHAIGNDEVDALVVVTRTTGSERVLTLEGSHDGYRHFIETMRDGAITAAEDGTILHANRRFTELAGREFVVGIGLGDIFLDTSTLRTLLQNASEEPLAADATIVRPDGSRRLVELSASVLPLPGVRRIGILVTDAGTRRRARPSAATPETDDDGGHPTRAVLESLLSHLPLGLVLVDARSGFITYANQLAEQVLGRVLVGVDRPVAHVELTAWRPDGTIVELEQFPIARAMRGEGTVREDLVRVRADGTVVQTRSTAVPVYDDDGQISTVVLALEDTTDEWTARSEREMNERFREVFIGVLGHDLRDPLAAVLMGSALLLQTGGLSPEHTRIVKRIASSAQRMGRMVTQILDFTRGRLGDGILLQRKPVDLDVVFQTVIAEVEAANPGRKIEVSSEGTAIGEWDADRLAQVASNLLGNAIQHGAPDSPIRVRIVDEGNSVRLEVHNYGPPIPESILPIIFDPFRRGGTGHPSKGLGLGLYITQQIVRSHGGTLTVESSQDGGTKFSVVLPRIPGSRPRIA